MEKMDFSDWCIKALQRTMEKFQGSPSINPSPSLPATHIAWRWWMVTDEALVAKVPDSIGKVDSMTGNYMP